MHNMRWSTEIVYHYKQYEQYTDDHHEWIGVEEGVKRLFDAWIDDMALAEQRSTVSLVGWSRGYRKMGCQAQLAVSLW
jgi:hypothetical protein